MNKGVLVGGGLGLLALAFLAGIWLTTAPVETSDVQLESAPVAGRDKPNPGAPGRSDFPPSSATAALPGPAPAVDSSPTNRSAPPLQDAPWNAPNPPDSKVPQAERMSQEERREVRSAVRAKMAELQAKGANATLADTKKLMDDIEALGQGQFDSRYFVIMRKTIEHSARIQVLSQELGQLTGKRTVEAEARRTAVLAEIRELGDRLNNGAQAMQSYANEALSGTQP